MHHYCHQIIEEEILDFHQYLCNKNITIIEEEVVVEYGELSGTTY